jgi:hypothetical protein
MHFAEATAMSKMATDRFVALATGVEVTAILTVGYRVGEPIEKPGLVGSLGVFDYVEDYLRRTRTSEALSLPLQTL